MRQLLPRDGRATALWSVLAVAFVLNCVILFAEDPPLQTNLMTLLPATERVIFLVGHRESSVAKNAARRFGASLSTGGALTRVQVEVGSIDPRRIIGFFLLRITAPAARLVLDIDTLPEPSGGEPE